MTGTTETALQQHPLSAAFPSMQERELEALAIDIEQHGQREPGVVFEGMVLDGWHRYQACRKVGVKFRSTTFDGDDPTSFVLSKNLLRRHLSESQRAAVAASLATRPKGQPKEIGKFAGFSQSEAAQALNVSERAVRDVKRVEREAPELVPAIRSGELSVNAAISKVSGKPTKPKVIKAPREIEKLYEACKAELVETKERLTEVADVARELNDKVEALETTDPDEQQKLIADLQLKLRKKDAEIDRLRMQIRDANNKNNELIRTVKRLQRKAGVGQ